MKQLVIMSVLLALLLCGCGDDDDPVSVGTKQFFSLFIDVGDNDRSRDAGMHVRFICSLGDVIPSVTVNGESIEYWNVGGMTGCFGIIDNIALSDSVEFTISSGGKTTSGKFAVPAEIAEVTCNSSLINSSPFDIEESGTYLLEWPESGQDYFSISWSAYDDLYSLIDDGILTQTETAMTMPAIQNLDRFYWNLAAMTGVEMIPGAEPNFDGPWGAGWVQAKSSFRANIQITPPLNARAAAPARLDEAGTRKDHEALFRAMITALQ
ncbi:MAG: hypothetical protein GY835_11190 [bacterium]|nr:hypothetical protein [bacterium]